MRVQNQTQNHEFGQKTEKNLIKIPNLDQNQSQNPRLDSGLATNLNNHQKQV